MPRLAKPLSAPTSRGLRRLERVVQLAHPLGREPPARLLRAPAVKRRRPLSPQAARLPARLELRRHLRQLALTPRPRRLFMGVNRGRSQLAASPRPRL